MVSGQYVKSVWEVTSRLSGSCLEQHLGGVCEINWLPDLNENQVAGGIRGVVNFRANKIISGENGLLINNSLRSEKFFLNLPRSLLSTSAVEVWLVHPENTISIISFSIWQYYKNQNKVNFNINRNRQ